MDTPTKRCHKCGREFPATKDFFYWSSKQGVCSPCRECIRAKNRRNYAVKIEYYRDKHREYQRGHRKDYALRTRRYRERHPDRVKERRKRYYSREKQREKGRKWRQRHPEKSREKCRAAYRKNKQRYYEYADRRRARKLNAEGTHSQADIIRQYNAQKGRCYYCGCKVGKTYHADHVIPLSRGGSDGPENIVIACPRCNNRKYNKLPHEWPDGGRLL